MGAETTQIYAAAKKRNVRWERFEYDYRFFMHENELFVAKYEVNPFSGLTGIFRPMLNHENLSFDLVEVDGALSDFIKQQQ